MPLLPRQLPRRFNRSVSATARRYAQKKQINRRNRQLLKIKRSTKKVMRFWERSKVYVVRGSLVALLCILLIIFLLLVFSPILHVRTLAIARTSNRLDQEEIQQVLTPLFNQHLFFVKDNDVEALLTASRSDIKNVTIEKVYPSELRVIIDLQPVIAGLRIIAPEEAAEQQAQSGAVLDDFITADGLYVQTVLPSTSGATLPVFTIVDWSVRPQPNQILLPPQLINDVFAAETILAEQFGQTVTERIVYVRAQEYHLVLGDRALWFDINSTLAEQIERYRVFLRAPINFPVTEYIDLRLRDRIIWR